MIEELKEELNYKRFHQNDRTVEIIKTHKIDINLAFDTLIKYNKKILEKNPIFNLEYHQDGTPKTKEELLNSINEENAKIITGILKIRYQFNIEEELNIKHTK